MLLFFMRLIFVQKVFNLTQAYKKQAIGDDLQSFSTELSTGCVDNFWYAYFILGKLTVTLSPCPESGMLILIVAL